MHQRWVAYLSSMTSLRTFIMATDCSSVKPSLCSRWTNLSVSKWWSRCRRGVAWKARWSVGLRRSVAALWLACGRADAGRGNALETGWEDRLRHSLGRAATAMERARVAEGGSTELVQLRRGSRKRGSGRRAFADGCAMVEVPCDGMCCRICSVTECRPRWIWRSACISA